MKIGTCMALAGALGAAAAAAADVVTLQPAKDNTLYEEPGGGYSNGAGIFMFVGETGMGTRRALLAFDIADAIPAGSIINSVSLRLHMSRTVTGPQNTQLHRVLTDWGEGASDAGDPGGSGALSEPGDATWIHTFYPDALWTTPGGDYDPSPSAAASVGNIGFYSWSSAQMVTDVQAWLDDPANNFGWLIRGVEDGGRTAKRFDTREHPDLSFRPQLTIDYTIPAPGTAVLGLLALVGLRRRR